MKKGFLIFIFCLFALMSCSRSRLPDQLSDLPADFPMIQPGSPPATFWNQESWTAVPHYNPDSNELWQVDLRHADLSALDLRDSSDDLTFASFDTQTKWPDEQNMPSDFDRQQILELGINPGLGVRSLHQQGITGKGVGIAIIDQPLLVEHQEYVDQLRFYEVAEGTTYNWTSRATMHGSAVASIAVGKTVGVAPEADLYFIGTSMCNNTGTFAGNDYACLAQSVRRVLEINHLLPKDRKIRVLSISVGWMPDSKGYAEITAATKEAKDSGLLVICSSVEQVHGFNFNGMGRAPLADPDQFTSYEPGLWWADYFYEGNNAPDTLMVPMDSRTTAGPGGVDEYTFYREGGASWSIPYIAGVYALAVEVKPAITPDKFWQLALETGQTIVLPHDGKDVPFGVILDPVALMEAIKSK